MIPAGWRRLFLDTSCWLAVSASSQGATARLLDLARDGRVLVVATPIVLQELADNVATLRHLVSAFRLPRAILESLGHCLEYAPAPDRADCETWNDLVEDRDARVLAGALAARTDVLVTLDPHLLAGPVRSAFPKPITTPTECLRAILANAGDNVR